VFVMEPHCTGKLRVRNGTTLVATSTTTLTSGSWYRIEWTWDGVAGTQTAKIYGGANLETGTATETLSSLAAVTGAADRITVGIVDSTTSLNFDVDELAVDGDKWIDSK